MKNLKLFLMFILFAGIFCSDYNPFENPANIKMEIMNKENSIYSDTLAKIFSSETLFVAGAVREEIDSFSISVSNNINKYFPDTTIVAPIFSGNYAFLFSFIDTGYVTITLTTFRKNGDDVKEEFEVYVTNPLNQGTIIISEFVPETLFIEPVVDNDVSYFWAFSPVSEELFTMSQSSNRFTGNITEFDHTCSTGYVWVMDSLGNTSPKREFTYRFVDTVGPVISSDNDGYNLSTNVIVTGDKTFRLKIRCNDLAGVNTALINDSAFSDFEIKSASEYIFYKTFYNMDTLSDSMTIIVDASDKLNHVSTDTFYVTYDAAGPKEVFHLISPSIEPYTTSSQSYDIQMEVFNLFNSSMYVIANHIEGADTDTLDTISISDSATILRFSVNLIAGDNVIVFSAFDSLGIENAVYDTVLLSYSSSAQDLNPPHIIKAAVNGIEGEIVIITEDSAVLELNAYDDNLDSIIINETVYAINSSYKWFDTMAVSNELSSFKIRLVDKSGNFTEKNIGVQRNNVPYISDAPLWPKTLVVGTPWKDTLTVSDEDGDTVNLQHRLRALDGSSSFNKILSTIVSFERISRLRWEVFWDGENIPDTLKSKNIPTQIYLSDNKSDTSYNWDFVVVDSADAKPFDFTVILPDQIDTTKDGAIDLSQVLDTIVLSGKIETNSQSLGETDTITLIFEEQIVKYNSTNGNFDIVIDVGNKTIDKESIIITVTDTLGSVTIVDTLDLVYMLDISESLKQEMSWYLRSDIPEAIETDETDTGTIVKKWIGEGVELIENSNVGDIYPYNPTLIEDNELPIEVIHFSRSGKNSLYDVIDLSNSSFTIFVVARLGQNASKDSSYCLISASGIANYTGFGIENGRMTAMGDSSVEIISASELRGGPYVLDRDWHIYTISSSTGIVQHNTGNITQNVFPANMWLDGVKTDCDSCVSVGTPENYPYFVLGGGGKHHAFKAWEGDVVEIIKFDRALSKTEIDEVNAFIASDFKIDINKYNNKSNVKIQRSLE